MMAKRTWKNFTMTKRLTGGAVLGPRDHRDRRARDAARLIRREEDHDGRDLVRRGPAPGIGLRQRRAVLRRVDDPWEDRVRGHAVPLELLGERLRPAHERGIRHRVARRALLAFERRAEPLALRDVAHGGGDVRALREVRAGDRRSEVPGAAGKYYGALREVEHAP